MRPVILTISLILYIGHAQAQMKQDIANYIAKYKAIAIEEMVRCKIPASITLAQGLHESGYGKSKLTLEANNHFGIKCKDEWDGKKYYQNDDAPNECFRVYTYAEESYADHSDFLVTRSRYANLFAMSITDYKGWATGLKADGYATNPKYAEILIKTIEDNNLTQYDQIGLAEISAREKMMNPETQPEQAPVAIKTKPQPSHKTITATVQATPTIIATATTPEIASVQPATTKTEILKPAKSTEVKTTTINGLRAMVAQGVTDPLAVAYDNQIDYEQVLAFNDLNDGDKFKDGENIFLQNKKARASQAQYVVQEGESMHDIAQKFGVKLRDLYQKNLMQQNDQPLSGEVVYLQEKRSAAPKTMAYSEYLKSLSKVGKAQSNNNGNGSSSTQPGYNKTIVQYTVAQSDTLYSIAKRFNVTVQQLSDLNNLQGQALKPGQTLVVTQ